MWNLNKNEQEWMEVLCSTADTVWLISLDEDRVKIFQDSMAAKLEGREMAYSALIETYFEKYICSSDLSGTGHGSIS